MAPDQVNRRAIHSGYWAFGLRGAERLVSLARTIVLARMLAPEDFGLFGIAALALAALEQLSQTGVRAALIQQADHTPEELDTAWTIQMARGLFLGAVILLVAPTAARLFDVPNAVALIRALALVPVFEGLTNIGVVRFEWGLEFRRRFWYRASGTIADAVVAVAVALVTRSPWALVFGFAMGSLVRSASSYLAHPYRPRFRWSTEAARSLFSFGRWVFLSELMVFLVTQGDDFLVAVMLGPTAIGLYQMAYLLASLPATQVTHVVGQVAFPSYARVTDAPRRLRLAYQQILFGTALVTWPMSTGILILANEGVDLVLGASWLPAVPAIQVLALLGAMRSFGATNGALFHGIGRPSLNTWVTLVHLLLMAALVVPLIRSYGIVGAALAVTLPMFVSQAFGAWLTARVVGGARSLVSGAAAPLVGTVAVSLVALGARAWLDGALLRLAIAVPMAVFVHYLVVRAMAPARLTRFLSLFRPDRRGSSGAAV